MGLEFDQIIVRVNDGALSQSLWVILGGNLK